MEKMNGKMTSGAEAAVNVDTHCKVQLFNKVPETVKRRISEEDMPDVRYFIAASVLFKWSHSEKGGEEKWDVLVYFKQIAFKYSK